MRKSFEERLDEVLLEAGISRRSFLRSGGKVAAAAIAGPEDITPSADDYLSSPMHQPFESKLNEALKLIGISHDMAGISSNFAK